MIARLPALLTFLLAIISLDATGRGGSERVAPDLRIIEDVTRLHLERLAAKDARESVVLARINAVLVPDGFANGARRSITVEITEILDGSPPVKQWTFSKNVPRFTSGPRDFVHPREGSPYESTGECDAILDISADGSGIKIIDTFAIPSEWAHFISEAYKHCRADPRLFEDARNGGDNAELLTLLANGNSPLACQAARILAADPRNVALLVREVSASKKMRQAVLTLMILEGAHPDSKTLDDLYMRLSDVVMKSQNVEELQGVALGVFAAGTGGDEAAKDFLLGKDAHFELEKLSAGQRLRPLLLQTVREKFALVDPMPMDGYLSYFTDLWNGESREKRLMK